MAVFGLDPIGIELGQILKQILLPVFFRWEIGRFLLPFMKDGYCTTKIDILISDEFDLNPYGINGKIITTPGHTPGSISVLLDRLLRN